ncbi:MAG: MFS transporter, partial [Chloroflexi bacterium]|nr:MFS transporter [Chloroflexota bacterium]
MPDSTDSNTSVDSASTAESRSEVLNQVQDDNADTGVSISRPPSLALMYGLSAGHGVKHFGQGALLIMIPSIKATFGLSDIAIGGIWSAQSISSGVANIPAGILTDMFRKKVAWILFASMMMVGAGYILISISPFYWVLLVGVVIIGFGTSMWHAPAFGTLAARYPRRRGFAM